VKDSPSGTGNWRKLVGGVYIYLDLKFTAIVSSVMGLWLCS